MRISKTSIALLTCILAFSSHINVTAQDDSAGPHTRRPVNGDKIKKLYEANLAKYTNTSDFLVLPGLLADRKQKTVEIKVESTGLSGNELIEFLLVDQNSSHGYEAMLWSFAKPSDVHKALQFIGLRPGAPFNPDEMRFFPKGELVKLSIIETNASGNSAPVRLENLILDKNTEKPLPESGFVFTGSLQAPAQTGQTGMVYVADVSEAKSIASLFNDPYTVMDVPRQASQGDVYNNQVVNPEHKFASGEVLTIIIEPVNKDGASLIRNLTLAVGDNPIKPSGTNAPAAGTGQQAPCVFRLQDPDGKTLNKGLAIEDALKELTGMVEGGLNIYLSVTFEGAIKLKNMHKISFVLALIESSTSLKIEPPARGQLFYKAFMPERTWRNREGRMVQPWELRLAKKDDKVTGTLYLNELQWDDDNMSTPKIKTTPFEVPTPEALTKKLADDAKEREAAGKRPALPVMLVFAEPEMTYGELMKYIEPILGTYNNVYVFDIEPIQPN